MTLEQANNTAYGLAYGLVLALGTILDEMNKGGEPATRRELEEMYGSASDLLEFFNTQYL